MTGERYSKKRSWRKGRRWKGGGDVVCEGKGKEEEVVQERNGLEKK